MSLRSKILTHALPHIPSQSFTLPVIVHSLSSLPSSHPDYAAGEIQPSVVDTLFGGEVGAKKALVDTWAEEGLGTIRGGQDVGEKLAGRLRYSAQVGEHLVEAYALLSTPTSSSSIPLPTSMINTISSSLPARPPLYSPPGSSPSSDVSSFSSAEHSTSSGHGEASRSQSQSHALPLLKVNPGVLNYAWQIANSVLTPSPPSTSSSPPALSRSSTRTKGYWDEPLGAGPEWYVQRIGLGLVYLSSEMHLLQPYPKHDIPNPHLGTALNALDRNLRRYHSALQTIDGGEKRLGEGFDFLGYVGRAWSGIIRSRGL